MKSEEREYTHLSSRLCNLSIARYTISPPNNSFLIPDIFFLPFNSFTHLLTKNIAQIELSSDHVRSRTPITIDNTASCHHIDVSVILVSSALVPFPPSSLCLSLRHLVFYLSYKTRQNRSCKQQPPHQHFEAFHRHPSQQYLNLAPSAGKLSTYTHHTFFRF